MNIDQQLIRFPYRYEVLLGLTFLVWAFWPMYAGFQAFIGSLTIMLVLLDARSASQYKRGTEDDTAVDRILSSIPFRYELLTLIALVVWLMWWLAAGATGFMLGLGVLALALRARSSSQLKRGDATPGIEV
jgi:Na+/H+ antiporter NhaC